MNYIYLYNLVKTYCESDGLELLPLNEWPIEEIEAQYSLPVLNDRAKEVPAGFIKEIRKHPRFSVKDPYYRPLANFIKQIASLDNDISRTLILDCFVIFDDSNKH